LKSKRKRDVNIGLNFSSSKKTRDELWAFKENVLCLNLEKTKQTKSVNTDFNFPSTKKSGWVVGL